MHLVEGTVNVTRHRNREDEPKPTGQPIKPKSLRGAASTIWDDHVAIGYWLTAADSKALAIWCKLVALSERKFSSMSSAMLAQIRQYGAALGFDPSSRSKINVGAAIGKEAGKNKADKFYS